MDRTPTTNNRPVQYSTFRQLALLNQTLRHAAGNQRQGFFDDDIATGAELEQGGCLDLSFEDLTLGANDDEEETKDQVRTLATNSTTSDEDQRPHDDIVVHSDVNFDATNLFGNLKRRSPLIQPDVSFYLSIHSCVQRKRFDFDSAEYFRDKYLQLKSSGTAPTETQ